MEGSCEETRNIKCDIFYYRYENSIIYNTNCWTIGSLLDEWFTYNNHLNIATDFYLETSFVKGNIGEQSITREDILYRRGRPLKV